MCLILVREPEVSLDYEKIKNACLNNPDGWGYVIPDRGKLEVRRFFSNKGNDPDEVFDVLDENLDKRVFIHLRFCTAGDRNKSNVHPFPVLQQRKHGMQAWIMHNGTVNEYKTYGKGADKMSDTYHFTQKIVSPLLQRVMAYAGKKGAVQDPFVGEVIRKFAGNWSKFVLIDQYGGYQIIGESDASKLEEGYWVSNDYSFRPSHRSSKPETKSTTTYSYGQTNYQGAPWYGTNSGKVEKYADIEDVNYEEVADQCESPFGQSTHGQITSTKALPKPAQTKSLPEDPLNTEAREKFLSLLGMSDLTELRKLEYKDILDWCNECPDTMAVLIMDLIWELYGDG